MQALSNLTSRSTRCLMDGIASNALRRNHTHSYMTSTAGLGSFAAIQTPFSKYQRFTYTPSSRPFYATLAAHPFSNSSASSSSNTPPVNELLAQVKEVEQRQKCRGVVDTILLDPRVRLPFDEYMEICRKQKLNEDESKKLSEALHTAGIIWCFNNYFEERKPLIIKTNEVCKAFLRTLDLDGTIRTEFVQEKRDQLKRYVLEIKPLEEQHEEIELKARKYVRNCWRGFFSYVVAHCMLVPYLTFWKYSWDIMEPVTYMFNLWTLFMGTWFYMNSSAEFSNEGISSALLRMRKEKLYKKYNFDVQRYTFLQEKIAEIEDDLFNPEWEMLKSVHPRIPDPIKHIHLTPSELLQYYETEEMQQNMKENL
eukprot:CAMPEP_0197037726 /NCGR_PEP_ID=MMETSP1384-20130603/14865_1 /TAXON_ID=29189 /ORGANISM="Ammonia sp." /LENGTH=366 /DNA_ID=CAMNT_0042468073 /DNA_START=24 /DNA_END=1124 /DNA_ORIENTATION=-